MRRKKGKFKEERGVGDSVRRRRLRCGSDRDGTAAATEQIMGDGDGADKAAAGAAHGGRGDVVGGHYRGGK